MKTITALVATLLSLSAQAGGIVDVARCTIEANERLPVGPELARAERACYNILPARVAQKAYDQRGSSPETRIVIEVHQNSVQAVKPVPRYYPLTPVQRAAPAPRYPYPYGPPPRYAAPHVYRVAPN